MIAFLAGPLGKLAGYAAAAGAVCMALLAAFAGVKRLGQQEEQNTNLRKTVADGEKAHDVQSRVDATGDADVDKQLRNKWTRG